MRDSRNDDRRGATRVPVHLAVSYRDASELASSVITSLSGGGVFIKTSKPLPIGTDLVLEILLDDDPGPPVRVRGRVVWDRLVGRDDGMGIRFSEELPERLRKVLTARGS